MEYYSVLLPLALILLISKVLITVCKRLGLPQVVGMLLAGVLIGLINYIPNQTILTPTSLEGLGFIAKIGVILLMFSAGACTDLKQIKKSGGASVVITLGGVVLPMLLGFLVACAFNGGFHTGKAQMLSNLFYGVVLAATSVSVTVATLKEMGKLNGKAGTSIVTAAILDDVIGVVVLSFVIGLNGGENGGKPAWLVLVLTIAFFVAAIAVGMLIRLLFKWMDKKFPHHRRVPIFSLAVCFFYSYASEKWFGVADITGAFVAGLILSGMHETNYTDRKTEVLGYMIFTPVFFANIGLTTKFDGMNAAMVGFGACFILAGIIGKVVGCGSLALACRYSLKDSVRVGVGMMARAEVALVCAQKGVENGLVDASIMPFILILIILTSFLTPLILKMSYKGEPEGLLPEPATAPAAEGSAQQPDGQGDAPPAPQQDASAPPANTDPPAQA